MSCSEAGAGKGGQEERRETERRGDDSAVMDWGPLRPPNSKASRKSCQSALSLSQSVQVAHVQGTWSDIAQKTHNSSTGAAGESVREESFMCACEYVRTI